MLDWLRGCRILLLSCAALLLSSTAAFSTPETDARDLLQYGPVTLEPGDVISFREGGVTLGGYALTHGHSSMYLGFDPEKQQQMFLDFSTTKDGKWEMVFGSPQAFGGRIMSEREFLTYNFRWHPSFDVYRLDDRSTLDKRKLVRRAKQIAAKTWFGLSGTVCSSAVADVLSAATGRKIGFRTPDGFEGDPFVRHPMQGREPIDIEQVLREKGRITTPPPQPAPASVSEGFLSKVAEEQKNELAEQAAKLETDIRTPDTTAEDSARAERHAAAWQYLKASLRLACSDPDNLRSLNDERKTWGVLISRAIVEDFFAQDKSSMSSCAQQLMTGVLRSNGPVDLKWAEKQGRRLFKEEQRRIKEQHAAAERAARAAAARAEYQAAEHRLSTVDHSSAGNSARGSSISGVKGSAYGQAVGIAGGLRTFDAH